MDKTISEFLGSFLFGVAAGSSICTPE